MLQKLVWHVLNLARRIRGELLWGGSTHRWRRLLAKHYQMHKPALITQAPQPRIPKIIHQIWLGSPLPDSLRRFTQTWQQHHPDWEYHLWTDETVKGLELVNREKYEQATNWAVKSDIVRYELLYQFGGLYVDTDFECFKPFDSFHHRYSLYTGISNEPCFVLCNALIAAAPGHAVIRQCVENVQVPQSNYWLEVSKNSGPMFFTKLFMNTIEANEEGMLALPINYFYPIPLHVPVGTQPRSYITPQAYGAHHWGGSWTK